ncbi:outer membrane protein TolC [Fluviicoccus keumensis]|uniref:Outer membrane protein TolC n=1 Tax=Fluviicoccus keumensis TaxID=1435465 RepID=A0A4V6MG17_9GAMM|nr:TolC family protein [Fluviicoccus keumensis]RZU48146.1 outer membrane protein TolC [Fluviicoccus keumensis]
MPSSKAVSQTLLVLTLTTGLGSCATLSDEGRERDAILTATGVTAVDLKGERVRELLAHEITMDEAATITLLNNPGLQRTFAELRLDEAQLVAATRIPNPRFSVSRLTQGSSRETGFSIGIDLIDLLLLPAQTPIARQRYDITRQEAARIAVSLAQQTRLAYVAAIFARQRRDYGREVLTAAEAGRDLARSLAVAGNISRLDAAREQAFYAEAAAQSERDKVEYNAALERLARLLGLTNTTDIRLPDRLPDLPPQPRALADIEQDALEHRLDVRLARQRFDNTVRTLKLTRITRFVNVLDLDYQTNTYNDQPRQQGVTVGFEIPIFDFGRIRTAGAEARYRAAIAEVAETAVNARSEARTAYQGYQAAYALARHYRDEVVPLQRQIAEEMQLRYNGMLISTFDLLAQAREQVAASHAWMTALNDYWVQDTILNGAVYGAGGGVREAGAPIITGRPDTPGH